MSRTWLEDGPIGVGTFAGPASEGPDRTRWQITNLTGLDCPDEYVVLQRKEALRLLLALAASLDWWCEPRTEIVRP